MKSYAARQTALELLSLPVRGAWIEIMSTLGAMLKSMGRSPCGERGLKSQLIATFVSGSIVAPRAGSVD